MRYFKTVEVSPLMRWRGAHGKDLRMASRSTWHSQMGNGHPSAAVARKKVIMQGRSGVDLCLAASSDGDKM